MERGSIKTLVNGGVEARKHNVETPEERGEETIPQETLEEGKSVRISDNNVRIPDENVQISDKSVRISDTYNTINDKQNNAVVYRCKLGGMDRTGQTMSLDDLLPSVPF